MAWTAVAGSFIGVLGSNAWTWYTGSCPEFSYPFIAMCLIGAMFCLRESDRPMLVNLDKEAESNEIN